VSRSILHVQPVAGQQDAGLAQQVGIVAPLPWRFVGLAARAAYIQVFATTFFSARAKSALRARWNCLPTAGASWIAMA
jgi:hypothetical protein